MIMQPCILLNTCVTTKRLYVNTRYVPLIGPGGQGVSITSTTVFQPPFAFGYVGGPTQPPTGHTSSLRGTTRFAKNVSASVWNTESTMPLFTPVMSPVFSIAPHPGCGFAARVIAAVR